ncbi:MAG: [protein-PII] uridylyltransferase, partial [Pseudomonadota bacterium]
MAKPSILDIPLLESSSVPLSLNQTRFRSALARTDSITKVFKLTVDAIDYHLNVRFKRGEEVRKLVYERALLMDCMLHFAWRQFHWSEHMSLVAVGGYGRGELHPQSDIDLLILTERSDQQHDLDQVQRFLTLLWDIGLNIGHSVRSLSECEVIAGNDITVVTSLIEARLLQGSQALFKKLQMTLSHTNMWPNEAFFVAKVEEQEQRHQKYNHTEYKLEPNVKNAPGGLRDIQTIQWVAKHFFKVSTLSALSGKGFFTEAEYSTLIHGEEFLWKVRYGLHMIAGRPEERLLFDYQRELAQLFGYQDQDGQLAIEQFMHEYYRIVISLRELNDVLLQFLDEAIIKRDENTTAKPINARFKIRDNFIEVAHEKVFEQNPSALLEIFVLAAQIQSITGFRAATIRLIRESRHLIDDDFRNTPANQQLFLELLRSPYRLVSQLRRMKRYGVLGRYLPEFDRIVGQMQHDLFHIYTVDDHTLYVIEMIRRFLLPDASQMFAVVANTAKQLPKIELLYIAGLYHDIGKGRDKDHSILGAIDAEAFCKRHRLSTRQTKLITWLVENHLAMSLTSQKQDLSDPDVIHNFARTVGDQLHLDYLYVLTVADMNATNPDIWNNWRASLLHQLYKETKRALRRGLENPIDREELISETQEAAMDSLLKTSALQQQSIWELWQTAGDDYFLRETSMDIVWHTQEILSQDNPENTLVLISNHTLKGNHTATKIFIRAPSRNNIFAAATTAMDQLNLTIQDARVYSTASGYTMDTFYVLDQAGLPIVNTLDSIHHIRSQILEELKLSDHYSDIIKRRTPRQLKYFSAATRATINNDLT